MVFMPSVWEQFDHDPRRQENAQLRAGDQDRDVVRRVLMEGYAEGRLDRDELDSRTDDLLVTRTLGELPALFEDLVPHTPATVPTASHRDEAVRSYVKDRRDAVWQFATVTLICWVIWFATSWGGDGFHPYFPWPVFPMMGTAIHAGRIIVMREDIVEDKQRALAKKERKAIERERRKLEPPAD